MISTRIDEMVKFFLIFFLNLICILLLCNLLLLFEILTNLTPVVPMFCHCSYRTLCLFPSYCFTTKVDDSSISSERAAKIQRMGILIKMVTKQLCIFTISIHLYTYLSTKEKRELRLRLFRMGGQTKPFVSFRLAL